MAKSKKAKSTIVDNTIELFLKKNRVFSKIDKIELSTIVVDDYIKNIITKATESTNIKYLMFQFNVNETFIERFLYTEDTYVIIVTDELLYNDLKLYDFSTIDLIISFFDEKDGLTVI